MNNKDKTVQGIKWSAIERFSTQFIQLIVMVTLGRILGPNAFGLISMIAIFLAISQTFIDSGFGNALIRKINRSEEDYSTVFYFNIIISILCYSILYFSAPLISKFYNQPIITSLIRMMSLVIIINSFSIVHRTLLIIKLNFFKIAISSITSVLISSATAIILAINNKGVWSLVWQNLLFSIISSCLIIFFSKWKPTANFSKKSFTDLFSFGSKLLLSSILDTVYNNIYQVIIGKLFTATSLGYFTQAKSLSSFPAITTTIIFQRVLFPVLSNIQQNPDKLEYFLLKFIKITCSLIFPMMVILAITSENIINIILGHQWKNTSEYMFILCFAFMLYPVHSLNLSFLQVKGRSDLFLKVEIIKKLLLTLILIITLHYGITAICYGILINSYIGLSINIYYTSKLSNLTYNKQLSAIGPIWLSSILIGVFVYYFSNLFNNDFIKLFFSTVIYLVIYVFYTRIFNKSIYDFFINLKNKNTEHV